MSKKRSKKYQQAVELVEKDRYYGISEAVDLLKQTAKANFDETVEVAFRLGVNPKNADEQIRGALVLPHGTGRTQTVLVFAQGEKAKEAEEAGADYIGNEDIIEKINDGWLDFDVVIATPDMMAEVGKLGRILGPKGLMPNPKTGTVTFDVGKAVANVKAGQVEYRVDSAANLHVPIGKVSFDNEKIIENFEALIDTIVRAKPAASRGTYVRNVVISSTMGPGIKIDVTEYVKDIQ